MRRRAVPKTLITARVLRVKCQTDYAALSLEAEPVGVFIELEVDSKEVVKKDEQGVVLTGRGGAAIVSSLLDFLETSDQARKMDKAKQHSR